MFVARPEGVEHSVQLNVHKGRNVEGIKLSTIALRLETDKYSD